MSKPIPTIQKWMSTNPIAIERSATLAEAHKVMRREGIRHLPVVDGGALVGIVTERDLHLIETLQAADPEKIQVEEAMTPRPYATSPDGKLDEVLSEMVEHKYGAAVVMQNHKIVGMFTTVDAMRACIDLLHARLSH